MMFVVDSLSPGPIWVQLYFDKTMVAILYVSDYHKKDTYVQMRKIVILKLQRGDHAEVVNFILFPETVDHQEYSAFSGTML